jgi:hypothetical protein
MTEKNRDVSEAFPSGQNSWTSGTIHSDHLAAKTLSLTPAALKVLPPY